MRAVLDTGTERSAHSLAERGCSSIVCASDFQDQTRFAIQNVKDTVTTVAAMKSASKELKVSMKEIKIDDIEDLHDGVWGRDWLGLVCCSRASRSSQRAVSPLIARARPVWLRLRLCCAPSSLSDMSDLLEDADEVNEIMGRAYGVPDELNEDDLMDGQAAEHTDEVRERRAVGTPCRCACDVCLTFVFSLPTWPRLCLCALSELGALEDEIAQEESEELPGLCAHARHIAGFDSAT